MRANIAENKRKPGATVASAARTLARLAPLAIIACSDHRVSPWPGEGPAALLSPYVPPPDLEGQLAKVDAEAAAHHLTLRAEIRRQLPRRGGPIVLRAYEGTDAVGRRTHAVRVATSRGVVMAIGPLEARDPPDRATELVAGLAAGQEATAFASGTDLNGDGTLDAVLRNELGGLEIWRLSSTGSNRYAVELTAPPTRGIDADGDGRVDLTSRLDIPEGDPIAPRFEDVATFDGHRWTNNTVAARGWHARRAALRAEPPPTPRDRGAPDGGTPDAGTGDAGRPTTGPSDAGAPIDAGAAPSAEPDAMRARRVLERAWHRLRAGEPRNDVMNELESTTIPPALRDAFEKHRKRIVAGR
jgi:hypothetical protein